MRAQHALGRAGRARGIENGQRLAGLDIGRRCGLTSTGPALQGHALQLRRQAVIGIQHPDGLQLALAQVSLLQPGQILGFNDQQPGLAVE